MTSLVVYSEFTYLKDCVYLEDYYPKSLESYSFATLSRVHPHAKFDVISFRNFQDIHDLGDM